MKGGGVCGYIFRDAGSKEMTAACQKIGHCDEGSAVIIDYAEYFDVSADWIIFGREDMERKSIKTETDEILRAFLSIESPAVRRVALEQVRVLVKL